MKNQRIMKREFLGIEVRQQHQSKMLSMTDISKLVPNKKPIHFLQNDQTKGFIKELCLQEGLNESEVLFTVRGKGEKSGTWGHELLAVKFAMWVNPTFEYHAVKWVKDHLCEYRDACGNLTNEIKDVIKEVLQPTEPWVYGAEMNMMQGLCGIQKGGRDSASSEQLEKLKHVQSINMNLLNRGIKSMQLRKSKIEDTLNLLYGGRVIS